MKKDIQIPKVEGFILLLFLNTMNTKQHQPFAKKIDLLPKKSYAKIELMPEALFALNNTFKVTFFEGNTMFDKTFLFKKNTINSKALQNIPLMKAKGVLVK